MELLTKCGYAVGLKQFKTIEDHIEEIVNTNSEFKIKVEITRGAKIKGTILQAVFSDSDDILFNTFADLVIDIDEVELDCLEPIWNDLANIKIEKDAFLRIKSNLDDILAEQGAFIGNGCILTLRTDLY